MIGPEDRDLIERVLGVSAFNAPHTMYSFEDVEALLAAVRAEAVEAADGFAAMEALDEFWDAVGHPNNRGTLTPAEQVASICRELDQAADALASRDAEIERLRGELRRAHLKRLVELSEEFGGYDELSTSALSALKTAREGNNA